MPETLIPAPPAPDPLLDLAYTRLAACPAAAQDDLLACLVYLRDVRAEGEEQAESIAAVNRHHDRVITLSSKGLARHEDRALSLMTMAITAMRDNTPASNAQAERTLRRIRLAPL